VGKKINYGDEVDLYAQQLQKDTTIEDLKPLRFLREEEELFCH